MPFCPNMIRSESDRGASAIGPDRPKEGLCAQRAQQRNTAICPQIILRQGLAVRTSVWEKICVLRATSPPGPQGAWDAVAQHGISRAARQEPRPPDV